MTEDNRSAEYDPRSGDWKDSETGEKTERPDLSILYQTEDQTPESDPGDLLYMVRYHDNDTDPYDLDNWEKLTGDQVKKRLKNTYHDLDQILQYLDSGETLYTAYAQYRRSDLDLD